MTERGSKAHHVGSRQCRGPGRGHLPKKRLARGFTLVELIAVVTIIGVLATIAVYSVRKYIQHAKAAEAAEIVGAIKAGQEAYFDETFRYLEVTPGNSPNVFYPDQPSAASGKIKIQWGADDGGTCTGCGTKFKALGVMPSAAVLFRYSCYVGAGGTNPNSGVSSLVTATPGPFSGVTSASEAFYVVNAVSDLDGDGVKMSGIVGSNLMGDLFSSNIGQ